MSSKPKSDSVVVTHDQPKDPRWDQVRETSDQLRACGRLFLRGQVKLGMMLLALKKEFGVRKGKGIPTSPDSGKVLPWADLVTQQTGYSRQSCDEFIRLYEAAKRKLKTSKNLNLPPAANQDAIVLFQSENALALTDAQWLEVDTVIGSLTTGETQASLMQELGLIPKPKPMPKAKRTNQEDDSTAGQMAFHFFDAMIAPLINSRTNPEYKKLLFAMPLTSSKDHPLSLATIEAECRAMLADIEDAKKASSKPAKGRTLDV